MIMDTFISRDFVSVTLYAEIEFAKMKNCDAYEVDVIGPLGTSYSNVSYPTYDLAKVAFDDWTETLKVKDAHDARRA